MLEALRCMIGDAAGSLPGEAVVGMKRRDQRKEKRPIFLTEHEAENTFRGATQFGLSARFTPYQHTVQPDNGSASRPSLIRLIGDLPVERALGKSISKPYRAALPAMHSSLNRNLVFTSLPSNGLLFD